MNPSMMRPGIDYIGVGVGGIIWDKSRSVLLAKRGPGSRNQRGLWENPGGAVLFGESLESALIREIKEELNLTVRVEGFLRLGDHFLPDEGQHWISPTFFTSVVSGEPTIQEPDKCSDIQWFDLYDVPPKDLMSDLSFDDLMFFRDELENGLAES